MAVLRLKGREKEGPHVGEPKRYQWIDAFDPTEEELLSLGSELGIPEDWIQNCLTPNHLPILEGLKFPLFLVVRVFDLDSDDECDESITELTRKVVFFILEDAILTVHRSDLRFIEDNRKYWEKEVAAGEPGFAKDELLGDLLLSCLETFVAPLNAMSEKVEEMESTLFDTRNTRKITKDLYRLKRRVSVLKRLLRMTHDLFIRSTGKLSLATSNEALVKDRAQSAFFTADELSESLETLVNQVFTLDAQKTNDTMRLLTIFSVFFLPLNVVTGIFGMNFDYMPLVRDQHGFFWVMIAFVVFAGLVVTWRYFREREREKD